MEGKGVNNQKEFLRKAAKSPKIQTGENKGSRNIFRKGENDLQKKKKKGVSRSEEKHN